MNKQEIKKTVSISPQEASDAVALGTAILIDVREEGELRQNGLAASAEWFPNSEMENQTDKAKTFIKSLSQNKTIIAYCAAGARSGRFLERLAQQGFTTANMGGYGSWLDAKLPIKKL